MESPRRAAFDRRQLALVVLSLIALYVIIPQIGSFRRSIPLFRHADPVYIAAATGCVILTYLAAAGTYYWLAFKPLNYVRTILIQIAGAFVNRLLPAGIGGMSINYAYLRKASHAKTAAASIVAVNNTLGFIGHGLLLAILLPVYRHELPGLQLWRIRNPRLILIITVVVLAIWLFLYRRYKETIHRTLYEFGRQLLAYRRRPARLAGALVCSMVLTLSNVLGLYLCIHATGSSVPFVAVFLVFTFGVTLGTATPTPGGLVGVEAGLVAGLAVYHLGTASALASVLIYRLLTYWIPLLIGAVFFIYDRRRHYI